MKLSMRNICLTSDLKWVINRSIFYLYLKAQVTLCRLRLPTRPTWNFAKIGASRRWNIPDLSPRRLSPDVATTNQDLTPTSCRLTPDLFGLSNDLSRLVPTCADSAPTCADSAPTYADSAPTCADSAPTCADSAPTCADSAPTWTIPRW